MLLKKYHEAIFQVLRNGLEYPLHPWEIQAETWIDLPWVDLPRGEDTEWIRVLVNLRTVTCPGQTISPIYPVPALCPLLLLAPMNRTVWPPYSTLTVQSQWDSQLEVTPNLSNLIPTHKATAVSCHPQPHKGSVSLRWTTCRDKKLTTCKDAKSLWEPCCKAGVMS